MSLTNKLVNLDAMIKREDFASQESLGQTFEKIPSISVRDFNTTDGHVSTLLRKPDFQRETNHWTPSQIVSLLECFVSGDLIPSVILWQSSSYLFVIDGGHRLSALKAWVTDDYGDGPISQAFFGNNISKDQLKNAEMTRQMVAQKFGSWRHLSQKISAETLGTPEEKARATRVVTRGLTIQWVEGNPEKAENSFFKINTKGTPLDEVEEVLLKTRRKPISIAARAIIRAGKGHRYWSLFPEEKSKKIEERSKRLHGILFEPELQSPVKTLELPLGGSKGVRAALQVLIDFMLISCRKQDGKPEKVDDQPDDPTGESTLDALHLATRLAERITGNENGSLGLHPAVYFYGPTGRHSSPMFMGTVQVIGKRISSNDQTFFPEFTRVREGLEKVLVDHKDIISVILQRTSSKRRNQIYEKMFYHIFKHLKDGNEVTEEYIVEISALKGRVVTGDSGGGSSKFTDDTKSIAFIRTALASAIKCPICRGYLDPNKSVSYDHVVRVRDQGDGSANNCQLAHPFCNQSVRQ